jgi:hypothetical protein
MRARINYMSSNHAAARGSGAHAMPWRLAGAMMMLAVGAAVAQPSENVIVTGTRERQVLEKFVQGFAAPTRMTGKLARWEDGICPIVAGIKPQFANFVAARVKEVAAQVGAPVNAKERCRPNIEVAFTDASQPFIDKVRAVNAVLLGYADNDAQLKALATVRRPIQAWYTTQTKDLRGKGEVDRVRREGMTVEMPTPPPCMGKCTYTITYPDAHFWEVTGSRLGDGLRSSFFHVIIVVEPAKLAEQEMGTLADYVAMVALAQIPAQDNCQPLPSIMNLLAKDCTAGTPNALTASDLGYLRGLYKISADRTLGTQESEIAYQMELSLKEQKP